MEVKIGDIIRYSYGSTALMRVSTIQRDALGAPRYYLGKQCMGGTQGCLPQHAQPARPADLQEWLRCAHWRGEGLPSTSASLTKVRLSFDALRAANLARLPTFKNAKGERAHSTDDGSDWKLTQWVNATAGEAGEYAELVLLAAMLKSLGNTGNTAKKIERGDVTLEEVRQKIADELADIATYLDILAGRAGVDLGQAIIDKFNRVSKRVGSPVFLKLDGAGHYLENLP